MRTIMPGVYAEPTEVAVATVIAVGIDTGCFGGRLTTMILNGDEPVEFVQVQASKQYCPWPIGQQPS